MSDGMTSGATPRSKTEINRGLGGIRLSAAYLVGMLLLFVGERLLFENTIVRIVLAAVGLAGIAVALLGRISRSSSLGEAARFVERRLLFCYLLGVVALLIYLAQADFVMDRLRPMFATNKAADRYADALTAFWPILWVCSVVPIILIELSYASMDLSRTVDTRRIRRSLDSGLTLSMSVCLLALINFVASEFNEKSDLSYFKTTRPSESSRKMVANLHRPLDVTIFYPGGNEALQHVQAYFEELAGSSKYLRIKRVDNVIEPKLAKKLSVTRNGVVVLSQTGKNEQIYLGAKMVEAKRKLKKLDSEFQTAFFKVNRARKTAYFTVGHDERGKNRRDNALGSTINDLRELFRKLNYQVKDLGIGQGLASEVPKDASLVILAGPRKELLPGEVNALTNHIKNGGRVLVLLDPEAEWEPQSLLGPFGLRFTKEPLANDRYYARVTYTEADRKNLFSVRYSSHPSVTTLNRNSPRLATVFPTAGFLEEIPSTAGLKPQVQFTVHSMPYTWNDANQNHKFDTGNEKRKIYELVAAVTLGKAAPKPKAGQRGKDKEADDGAGRLIVVADSDAISDQVFRRTANGYLILDGVKWLVGDEEFIGETASEEDVRITHTRQEDQVWFYLTIFAVPAFVLSSGVVYTRRRRRKR